jgi:hypothetical protein
MGAWSHAASRIYHAKMKVEPDEPNEFKLE